MSAYKYRLTLEVQTGFYSISELCDFFEDIHIRVELKKPIDNVHVLSAKEMPNEHPR